MCWKLWANEVGSARKRDKLFERHRKSEYKELLWAWAILVIKYSSLSTTTHTHSHPKIHWNMLANGNSNCNEASQQASSNSCVCLPAFLCVLMCWIYDCRCSFATLHYSIIATDRKCIEIVQCQRLVGRSANAINFKEQPQYNNNKNINMITYTIKILSLNLNLIMVTWNDGKEIIP